MSEIDTQCRRILTHLCDRPITPLEALNRYGCFRLAARIKDLRAQGHDIRTETVRTNGKAYAQYRLVWQPALFDSHNQNVAT